MIFQMGVCDRGNMGFHHLSMTGRESVSSASLYKQRIDSMFDDERSIISNHHPPSITGRSNRYNKVKKKQIYHI